MPVISVIFTSFDNTDLVEKNKQLQVINKPWLHHKQDTIKHEDYKLGLQNTNKVHVDIIFESYLQRSPAAFPSVRSL